MTVAEMIAELQKLPPHLPVFVMNTDTDDYNEPIVSDREHIHVWTPAAKGFTSVKGVVIS